MRNYKGSFYRTDESSKEPEHESSYWLRALASQFKDEEVIKTASSKTAVEVARERQSQPSIYEMMSAIVSGKKSKYSSVEEAVKDYQRRTGLEDYLKRGNGNNDLSVLAGLVTEAAHGVCDDCGCSYEECECDKDKKSEEDEDDVRHELPDEYEEKPYGFKHIEPVCEDCGKRPCQCQYNPNDYEELWDELDNKKDDERDVRDMTHEEMMANPGKKKLISEAEDLEVELNPKPEILQKNPTIEYFLNNLIDTNIGIQMPAILHSLLETFGRDGIDHNIFSDHDLLAWINNKLINKGITDHNMPSQLGRGVGTQIDYSGEKDPNKDPFILLEPNKGAQ